MSLILLLAGAIRLLLMSAWGDRTRSRLWWLLSFPFLGFLFLPIMEMAMRSLLQTLQLLLKSSSRTTTWSGAKPSVQFAYETGFKPPDITILIYFYKEGLEAVLKPTLISLLKAVQQYEKAGGKLNFMIGDDGMQLIDEDERAARIRLYQDLGVSWVARPRHNPMAPVPYVRAGKFKYGSNMNNVFHLATQITSLLEELSPSDGSSAPLNDIQVYDKAVAMRRTVNWVGGDLRMGELLLLADSDLRVPKRFLLDLAIEFFVDPQLGVLNFVSRPLLAGTTFERWAGWRKEVGNLLMISYAKSGSTSLTTNESTFTSIRADALKAVAYTSDSKTRYWSEDYVMRHADLYLRIQIAAYRSKLSQYSADPQSGAFEQNVSLQVTDYIGWTGRMAYGASRIVFNPVYRWIWQGPFTPIFRAILTSNITLAEKVDFCRFCAAPFTLASSLPVTMFHYFYIGLHRQVHTSQYVYCWKVFLSSLLVLKVFV